MTLADKAESLYVALTGNRVTLASRLFTTAYVGSIPFFPDILLAFMMPATIIVYGGEIITCCGLTTPKFYNRTRDHIKKFDKLDPRFVKEMIKETENREFVGYCQLQGMYLAARNYGQLDVFKDVKKEISNCRIPNF
tara:strand:- start:70 stop:480 length:411 start_codon:yes stop_codon:yes gene_type:complete